MTINEIDLRTAYEATSADLSTLESYLDQLIGEPFQLARISYGDELTLHFGDLRPAASPLLKNHEYGAYVLGLRSSNWVLKAVQEPCIAFGIHRDSVASKVTCITKEALEAKPLIHKGSRVRSLTPYIDQPTASIGLQISFSDGSALHILPALPEVEEPSEIELPALSDWELLSPGGLLRAGPGVSWSFQPATKPDASQKLTIPLLRTNKMPRSIQLDP